MKSTTVAFQDSNNSTGVASSRPVAAAAADDALAHLCLEHFKTLAKDHITTFWLAPADSLKTKLLDSTYCPFCSEVLGDMFPALIFSKL